MGKNKVYLCIDLKSFYASVECVERGLDPLTTNLVVADDSRTEKTICLAVTPSMKKLGIGGRARLFEVVQRVSEVNYKRSLKSPGRKLEGESYDDTELISNPKLGVSYITAPPRMEHYMRYSTRIYEIYLKYVSEEDILVYSIDEVFMDITNYLATYKKKPYELAHTIIYDVLKTTGITATAGIGTNMYLAKIAMDITAKKMPADKYGVRIAQLNEMSYRKQLWEHTPLTDFWRVGVGTAKKLCENRIYTMGDIAKESTTDHGRKLLKKMFGINAKMLVDHAWGYEPCTISEAKAYTPGSKSISTGQVLSEPYTFEKGRVIVWEMLELLALDLVDKGLVTNQLVLTVGYDVENITNPKIRKNYKGKIKTDMYGRKVPEHAYGTANINRQTSSTKLISEAVLKLYDDIVNENLLVRRITIAANNLIPEKDVTVEREFEQIDLFTDYDRRENEKEEILKERKIQQTIINIKHRYGKNAIIKGTNLTEGATSLERNRQIGGHKA